ncbi:MAG: acyl-CoA dehydrogenase family protein, partial [Actinomycetota bacterium]
MDVALSPEEISFRDHVRAWIKDNLPDGWGTPGYREPQTLDERFEFAKVWEHSLSKAGWAGLAWPKEYGGRGTTLVQQIVFHEEMARAKAPQISVNFVGINLAGPTIMAHGTEEQKKRFLPPILSMDELWCQGFSEPNAGSDLANVQTRAELQGDHFVVNGQKIWTSYAHIADWCLLLCRTDPAAPKHKGLSYLLVDMKTAGIDPRPLKQITGDAEFNEVFFTDVIVPRENLLGEMGLGWTYANTTLSNERGPAFLAHQIRFRNTVLRMLQTAARTRRDGMALAVHPAFRQRLAAAYAELEIMRYLGLRLVTSILRNGRPGPEGSVVKLYWSHLARRVTELALAVTGPDQALDGEDAEGEGFWQRSYLMSFAQTIAAGSS